MSARRDGGRKVRQAGFTLVEVLIAISVLAVTMGTAYALFASGLRFREATRTRLDFDRDARTVLTAIEDDLGNLVPGGPVPFVAEDFMVLLRLRRVEGSERTGPEGVQLVTYRWSTADRGDSLLTRVVADLHVAVTDSLEVDRVFREWAGSDPAADDFGRPAVRVDEGRRFGDRAQLGTARARWVGYPAVRDFSFDCRGVSALAENAPARARLTVRLSPEAGKGSTPVSYLPITTSARNDPDDGMTAVFWVPSRLERAMLAPLGPEPWGLP